MRKFIIETGDSNMSRTLKDSRLVKERRHKRDEPPLKSRYLASKRDGFSDEPEREDLCPECNGHTDFANGVLICPECDWNSSGVKMLSFYKTNLKRAA
jgi:hypothetical protein